MTEVRICALKECGKPLIKRDNEKESDFKRRETCGVTCGSRFGSWRKQQNNPGLTLARLRKLRLRKPRSCAVCDAPIVKHDGETQTLFNLRKACSPVCAAIRESDKRIYNGGWPKITGEIDWNNAFAAHNIIPPNEYGSLPHRADARTYTGCSAAMAYVRGE